MSYRLRQGGNLASLVLMVFMIGSLLVSSITSVLDLAQIQRATEADVNTVIQYGSLPDAREKRVVERRVAQAASADSLTAACKAIGCSEPAGNEKVAAKLASIVEHGVEWGINPYKGHAGYYHQDGIGVFGAPPEDARGWIEQGVDAAKDAFHDATGIGEGTPTPNPLATGEIKGEDAAELGNVYNKMFGMMYYFSATRVLVSAAGIGSQVWHVLRITARGIGAFFLYIVFFSAKFVQILGLYLYKFIDVFNIFRYINIARLGGGSEAADAAASAESAPEFFKAMQELLQHTYNIGTIVALFVFAVGLFAVVVGINFGSGSGRSGATMSLVRRLLVSVLTMGGAIAALSGLVTSFSLQMGQQADDMGVDNTIQGLIADTEGFITAAYYPMGPELAAMTDSSYLAEAAKIVEDTDKSVDERMKALKALETRKVSENADEKEKAAKEYLEAYYQFSMPNLKGAASGDNTVSQFDYGNQIDNVPSLDTMAGNKPILNRSMTDGAVAAINFSAGHVIDGTKSEADPSGGDAFLETMMNIEDPGPWIQNYIQNALISNSMKGAQDIISGTSAELLNGWSSGHQFTGGDLKARYGEHAMIVPVGYLFVENGFAKSAPDAGVLSQWSQVNHYSFSIPGGVPGAFLRWAKAVIAMLFKVLFALAIYAIMFGYIMDMMRRVLTKFWGALYFGSLGAFMVLIASVIVMMAQIMMSRIVLSMFVSLMNSPKQIIAAVTDATAGGGGGGVILNTISLGALLFDLFGTLLIGYLGFIGLLKFNKNFGQAIGEASQTVANKLAGGFGADTSLAGNAFDGRSSLGNRFSEGLADKAASHGKRSAVIGGIGAAVAGYGAYKMLGDSVDDIENRINGGSDASAMDDTVSDNPDDQVPEGSAGSLSESQARDRAIHKESESNFQEGANSMSRKRRRQIQKGEAVPISSVGGFDEADENTFVASAVHSDVAEALEEVTQRRNTRFNTASGAVSAGATYGEDGQTEALAAQQAEQTKYEEEKSEVYKSLVKDIRSGGVSLNGNAQLADVAQDLHTGLDVQSASADHMTNLYKMDVLNKSIAAQESYESAVDAQGAALNEVDQAIESRDSARIQAAQQDLIMATSTAQITGARAEAAHADLEAAGYEGATDGESLRQSRDEAVQTVISQDVLWESKQGSSAAPDVQLDGQEATQSVDVTQEVAGQEAQAPVGFGGGQMDIRDNLDQTTYVERDTVEASSPQGGVVGSDSTRESVSRASASGVTSVNDTVQVNRQEEEVSASHAPRSSSASGVTSVNDTVQVNRQEDVQSTTSRPQSSASGVTSVNDTVQVNRQEDVQSTTSRPMTSASGGDTTRTETTTVRSNEERVQGSTSGPVTSASGGNTTRTETTTVRSNEERVQGSTSGPVTSSSGGNTTRTETTTVRSNEERVQGTISGPVASSSGGNTTRTETTTVRSNEERVQGTTSGPVTSSSGGNTTRTETTTVRSNEERVQGSTSRPVTSSSGGNTTRTETTTVRSNEERVQGTSSRPQSSASGGNTTRTETTKVRSNDQRVQGSTSRPVTSSSGGNTTWTETTTVNHQEVSNASGGSRSGRNRQVTDTVDVNERVDRQSGQDNTRSGVRGRRDRVENVTDVDESVTHSGSSEAPPSGASSSSSSQGPTQANDPFSGTSLERGQIDKE